MFPNPMILSQYQRAARAQVLECLLGGTGRKAKIKAAFPLPGDKQETSFFAA